MLASGPVNWDPDANLLFPGPEEPGPMKPAAIILFILMVAVLSSCSTHFAEAPMGAETLSVPADKELETAMQMIEKAPDSPLGYNQLAVLYIKRARETGDFKLNSKAEAAIQKALAVEPNNASAKKLLASLHLTFHRFREALRLGNELINESPDDAFVYGVLTDANAELGNYAEAVKAAQKMVDLRPNSQSYARVAHLRSLHGDHSGAVEMYKLAARTADPQDREAQCWSLVQLGNELWRNGKYDASERAYDEALQILPGYHLALSGKGRLLASKGELAEASKLLADAKDRFPNPDTIILLGDVYAAQGDPGKAREQYELVEAGEEKLGEFHDAHRLALFWADHDVNLDEALKIARDDYAEVKDIYAADILAWCLYKKGELAEARSIIDKAMRLNTNDARIYYHAAMIELGLGNRTAARKLMTTALSLNPVFDVRLAPAAKRTLAELR